MFVNPFDGARAKLERSKRHFDELIAAEQELSQPQPVTVILEPQPNGDTIVFGVIEQLPKPAHGAIVADTIGNFRSALDIAAHQACVMRGATNKKDLARTYFPFGGSEKDWDANLERRMAAADAALVAAVRSFKPWKEDGNALLYALSKIVADDKHIALVAVATQPSELIIDGMKFYRGDGKGCGVQGKSPVWSTQKAEMLTVLSPAKVEIAGPCVLKAKIGFGEVYALTGKPVIPTLNEMGAMCEKIVDAIEAAARLP